MGNGYWGKLLRINLTDHSFTVEEVPEETCKRFVGGSALGAALLLREVPPGVDPLSPENKLTFGVGCFQAGKVPGNAKWSVCTKSPLTGTWLDSAGAGTFAPRFKQCGYDHLVVEGRSPEPVHVHIGEDGVDFLPAADLMGLDIKESAAAVKARQGKQAAALVIGPAGERGSPIGCISCDGMSFAGRGGAGSVMGSKNLKAISARGSRQVPVHDPAGAQEIAHRLMLELYGRGEKFRAHGSPIILKACDRLGDTPVKYWRGDGWPEGAQAMGSSTYTRTLQATPIHCSNCPVGCHRLVTVEDPPEWALKDSGPEYETVAMLGTSLLIDNLYAVAKGNDICNRYGIDTISAGSWVGFLMDCYERGLLNDADLGGPARWGDERRMLELVEEIARGEGVARFFDRGLKGAVEKVGPGAEEVAVHVKNMDMPAHDPRAVFALGVSYATCPIGASHMRGHPQALALGMPIPELGWEEPPDRFDLTMAAEVASKLQDLLVFFNSLSYCVYMVDGAHMSVTEINQVFNAITGWDFSVQDMLDVGARGINLQRLINLRDGFTRADDRLPPKMFQPASGGPRAGQVPGPHDHILNQYYEFRGWDREGRPTSQTLADLGLEEFAGFLPGDA